MINGLLSCDIIIIDQNGTENIENWRLKVSAEIPIDVTKWVHTFSSLDFDDWIETNYDAKSWLKTFELSLLPNTSN